RPPTGKPHREALHDSGGTTVRLPLPLAHHQPTPTTPADHGPDPLAGHRVLVVDDNHTNRLILHEQLTAWGLHVDLVPDGPGALRLLAEAAEAGTPYDLALLDLSLTGTDGLAVARRASRSPLTAATSLLLLTSGPEVGAEAASEAGLAGRLTKPVQQRLLRDAVREALARPAERSEAVPDATPEHPQGAEPVGPRRPGRGHVLVVEDREVNQLVAVGILEHLGYTTDVAPHGQAALEALEHTAYDAVLMDC
ncbi:response regulator, partial [Nocardioides ferulae]|uniref:response regulator n=1 Tax=Nocardioides ferulae TaxID=2340821 RepID=UPI000EB26641